MLPASKVKMEKINWLVDQWIPASSLTLLAGREGIGKSTIACYWAAAATRGDLTGTPINVAYVASEDNIATTVVPRLKAAGAELERVLFPEVEITSPGDPGTTTSVALSLPGDSMQLAKRIKEDCVGLLILDAAKPVMSERLDGNKDTDIRQFLEPLSKMAQEANCVVLGLVHFGKKDGADTGKLILGSAAWSQVARSVLAVRQDPDSGTLFVSNAKGNLSRKTVSRMATVESAEVGLPDGSVEHVGVLNWGNYSDHDGSHLASLLDTDGDPNMSDAEIWLWDLLEMKGSMKKRDVLTQAHKDNIAAPRTIQRAFAKIGGVSEYSGFPRMATWSLPSSTSQNGSSD